MYKSYSLFLLQNVFYLFIIFTFSFLGINACTENEQKERVLKLTLTSAISRVLNDNRQLEEMKEGVTNSQFDIELADNEFQTHMIPNGRAGLIGGGRAGTGVSIGGGIDLQKKYTTGTQISIGPTIMKTCGQYQTEIRAMIAQPLLRGLGKEYQLSNRLSAQFFLRSSYRNFYIAQVQLIVRTIQALYDVVKMKKSLLLQQESHQRIQQFYQAAKLKEKIGLSDAHDIYRAEIELRCAEDGLTASHESFQEAEDIVRDLLALPPDCCIEIELPLTFTANVVKQEEAIHIALDHRIEIEQARDQQLENQRISSVAKKNLVPELNLVFNYSNCGTDEIFTRSCTRHRESTWGIGFTTSTDFDPIVEKIAYERSLLELCAAEREIDQVKSKLILEIKKVMRQLKRAYQRIHLQEEQIKITQGELKLAKIKFDHNLADNFNVIQAEKSLRNAQQGYWFALIDHIVGEFHLIAAVGLLIDKPNIP